MASSATASPAPDGDAPRRSGRVVRAPEKFSPESTAAVKRKRDNRDDGDAEVDVESDAEMGDEPADATDDEDATRRKAASKPKRSALKKPKVNGAHPEASSHATSLARRPKTVRIANAGTGGNRLFDDIFASGHESKKVAAIWYERYQEDEVLAETELINCVLQCAGCDQKVTEDDIRDPDNCPNRLNELQSIYQEQNITDYPLLSKTKTSKDFRELLTAFFHSLVRALHESGVLYQDQALMQNLHTWVAPMSSSTLRPFRHTASTIALAIQSAVVNVAKKLDDEMASIGKQLQNTKNKKTAAEMKRNLDELKENRQICINIITDFFDTVFVHRYRDVDPRIRTECVEALGSWVLTLPVKFQDPEFLRYLGWMLSDVVHSTRLEVLKQLTRIFKRENVDQLGHFIDRFRPRLIEMATKDSEVAVRVASIGLLDIFRDADRLEPDDIDIVDRLMFDSDARMRKSVVNFFTAVVEGAEQLKWEELGGETREEPDVLKEAFLKDDDRDDRATEANTETLRSEWVYIKCLAENLASLEAQLDDSATPRGLDVVSDVQQATMPETRLSLAAQALYEKSPVLRNWELIAGYLLFDHTTSSKSRSKKANPTETALKKAVAPDGNEEYILLEVLAAAVKASLSRVAAAETDKSGRKMTKAEAVAESEKTALRLASKIPRLLKKFGADPDTATVVLRLAHLLDLQKSQHLRQDTSVFEELLEEVSTQFSRHNDKRVLSEAAAALLHARQYDELEEIADSQVSNLWDNVIDSLRSFDKICELTMRGNLDEAALRELSTVVLKISKLASISDCVEVLEREGRSVDSTASAIELLVDVVQRGKLEQDDEELSDLEDEVVSYAVKSCQFYFMWKMLSLTKLAQSGAEVADGVFDTLAVLRDRVSSNLAISFSTRAGLDDLRLFAAGSLCDVHVCFASLRSVMERFGPAILAGQSRQSRLGRLIAEINPELVPEMISIFDTAERAYAKKANKTLNEPGDDEDPIDDDFDEDEEASEELSKEEKQAAELRAEKVLCELAGKYVLAITARVLDQSGPRHGKLRKRLLRNQAKLGANFREVVAYLDEKKLAELAGARSKKTKGTAKGKEPARSAALVVDEDEDDPFADEPEEGSREDLIRRELLDDHPEEDGDDEPVNDVADEDDLLGD